MIQLPEQIKVINKSGDKATFEIGPLMPGYGPTIANPLRRVLLSSLEGAAIVSIKIKGVDHEFGPIAGVMEDIVQIIANIKKIRLKMYVAEPITLSLSVKGETEATASDIKTTSDVEIINPGQHICTLTDKKASVEMELTVEKGRGYVPVEQRQKDKLPIGMIAVDAIYSPVRLVNFTIEDVRVGQRIDFNKIVMEIETDGSMQPEQALKEGSEILRDHFNLLSQVDIPVAEDKAVKKTRKPKVKKED